MRHLTRHLMRIPSAVFLLIFFSFSFAAGAIVAEEVVVESSLNVRNPAAPIRRRTRAISSVTSNILLQSPGPLSPVASK